MPICIYINTHLDDLEVITGLSGQGLPTDRAAVALRCRADDVAVGGRGLYPALECSDARLERQDADVGVEARPVLQQLLLLLLRHLLPLNVLLQPVDIEIAARVRSN